MVTVIIPYFNYKAFIRDAVLSVYNEPDVSKIIIVDDGSDYDNRVYLKNKIWCEFEDKVLVVDLGSNKGVSVARNVGLRHVETELVTFLDSDDMKIPGGIREQVEYLNNHPDVDVVWGSALEIRGDVSYAWACEHRNELRRHPSEVNPQTVMYRRKVFDKFGGFYRKLKSKEDKAFHFKIGIHPKSPFKGKLKSKKLKEDFAFYRKHPLEKHKRRKANPKWAKKTKSRFKLYIKKLEYDYAKYCKKDAFK